MGPASGECGGGKEGGRRREAVRRSCVRREGERERGIFAKFAKAAIQEKEGNESLQQVSEWLGVSVRANGIARRALDWTTLFLVRHSFSLRRGSKRESSRD